MHEIQVYTPLRKEEAKSFVFVYWNLLQDVFSGFLSSSKLYPPWMNDRGHTNPVPRIYAIGPENHLGKLSESDFTESANFVHSWYGFDVAPFIHGIMVRNWCALVCSLTDSVYSEHCTVYCTLYSSIHLADFLKKFIHPITLRNSCNSLNSPYGVIKISINLLWPVQVTLEVIKRHIMVFCSSCDGVPLKWRKNLPSLQFVITVWMSLPKRMDRIEGTWRLNGA